MGSFSDVHSSNSQNYDRIDGDEISMSSMSGTVGAGNGDGGSVIPDITAGQKMVSAMSGSLLTSLLGKQSFGNSLLQALGCSLY